MDNSLQTVVQTITNIIRANKNVFGISLVGSSTNNKNYTDIDLLVIGENKSNIIKYIIKKFANYNIFINDDSIRINGLTKKEVGIAIYEYKELKDRITKYINGLDIDPIYKNWNIVGWLPECLLYDLNNMIIIYEMRKRFSNIKKIISSYPLKMKKAIIESCNLKISNISKRSNKAKKIEKEIIKAEIIALEVRKKFAEKEMYFNGFKKIDDQLRKLEEK